MKKKLHYETRIAAPCARVWDTMLQRPTYREWTKAFSPASDYEGSWEAGAAIRFVDGTGNGIVAEIAESRRPEFVSIRHLGMIKDGKDDTTSEAVRQWAPSYENYTLRPEGGGTLLLVDCELSADWEAMMNAMWPQALERLKQLCEAG